MTNEEWKKYIVPEKADIYPRHHRGGIFAWGPEELHLRENIQFADGPQAFVEANPQLFATSSTSNHEGYAYWALLQLIGPEGEPGRNGQIWFYQSSVKQSGSRSGGSIVDFLVETPGMPISLGIRIVTPWIHELQGAAVRAFDAEQVFRLFDQDVFVVDVRSAFYINDKTGQDVIKVISRAIQNQPDYSPYHRTVRG